jgi:hypothetical protein
MNEIGKTQIVLRGFVKLIDRIFQQEPKKKKKKAREDSSE